MALFRNKFQILGMNSLKKHWQHGDILDKRPKSCAEISTRDLKYFWTTKQKTEARSKSAYYPNPIDNPLITRGNTSTCLQGLKNNKKKKVCKPQESFWTYLFGEQKSETLPDPCTCKLEYKCKQSLSDEDPRLFDTRCSATPGDVLLFSEHPKRLSTVTAEPQPKPPPPYKIPTAVTSKRIASAIGGHTCVHIPLPSKGGDCKKECLEPEPFWIPYTEFKPMDRPRYPFTCEGGKRVEDVVRPINKDMYPTGMPSFGIKNIDPDGEMPKKFSACPSSSEDESFAKACKGRKKLSRTERLKILTAGRDGVYKSFK